MRLKPFKMKPAERGTTTFEVYICAYHMIVLRLYILLRIAKNLPPNYKRVDVQLYSTVNNSSKKCIIPVINIGS